MTETIRVGLVGAGGIARSRHLPGLRAIDGVEVSGVVTRSPSSTRRAAEELAIPTAYPTWEALVADPAIDAVVVATWPYLHAPVTIAALAAGRHVLCEGRMAMDAPEARAMLAASRARPDCVAMLVPGPFTFFADDAVRRMLRDGAIGTPHTLRATWAGGIAATGHDQWRRERRFSGNNVMTLGILYESVARWLGHAEEVSAVLENFAPWQPGPDGSPVPADVADHAVVVTRFPEGVVGTFEVSAYARSTPPNAISIHGPEGGLVVDLTAQQITLARPAAAPPEPVEIAPGERGAWRVEEAFIAAIRGREAVTLNDFATGVAYMAFTDAVHASAESGARVRP
jgi:predicted dehydrogenase